MRWPYPLFRLFWQPLTAAVMVLGAALVLGITLLPVAPGKDLQSEIASGVAQVGMVSMVGMFGVLAGWVGSVARRDLWQSGLDWQLPGLRRWLLAEEVLLGAVVATLAGLAIFWVHSDGTVVVRIVVGTAFTLACFAAAGFGYDSTVPQMVRLAGFGAFYILMFSAEASERVLLYEPTVSVVACLAATLALWTRRLDRRVARRRPRVGEEVREAWAGSRLGKPSSVEWSRSTTSGHLGEWLRAIVFEGAGFGWRQLARMYLMEAVMIAAILQLVGSNLVTALLLGTAVFIPAIFPLRFTAGFLYPLSRRQRATVAAAGALLVELSIVGITAVFLLVVKASPLAELWRVPAVPGGLPWPLLFVLAYAWMPLGTWVGVQGSARAWGTANRSRAGSLMWIPTYSLALVGSAFQLRAWWNAGQAALVFAVVAAIAVLTRVALWRATQRHFAKVDLGLARSGA